MHYGPKITIGAKFFPLDIMLFGFQKHARRTMANSNNVGLDLTRFDIIYPTIVHF
jgi:hypothetical protein